QAAMSRTETKSRMSTMTRLVRPRPNLSASVGGGRDDYGDPERERADQDGERRVLVLDDLLPQLVGRQRVDDHEGDDEHHDAEEGEDRRAEDVGEERLTHLFPPE